MNMRTQNTIKSAFILILFTMVFTVDSAAASSIYGVTSNSTVKQGDEFRIDLYLDTKGDTINVLEGSVRFSKDTLDVVDILSGNSFVTFWIDSPEKDALTTTGSTTFSGIIPGGYRTSKGYLYSIIFKAKKSGLATANLENLKVVNTSLVNNVDSTKSEVVPSSEISIYVTNEIGTSTVARVVDTISPEDFKPFIGKDEEAYNGNYYLAFASQDKGVGIAYYEVKEGRFGSFARVTSPYILKNQKANDIIYINAIDKNGNSRTISLRGPNYTPLYANPWLVSISLLVLIVLGLLTLNRSKRRA